MSSRRIIVVLLIILAGVAAVSLVQKPRGTPSQQAIVPSPTPYSQKKTGTFVDTLIGQFVYFKDGGLYQVQLPSLQSIRLAGLGTDIVRSFPAVRSSWSADGTQFVFLPDDHTLVVTQFTSGNIATKISLSPSLDLSKQTHVSFAPDGSTLLLKQEEDVDRSHIRFFSLPSGSLVGEQASCNSLGAWLRKSSLYATTCQIEGRKQIMTIDAHGTSLVVRPIGSPDAYTFINEYDSSSLFVKKGERPGKLSLSGQFTPVDNVTFKNLAPLDAFANLPKALATKIMQLKKTEVIDDIEVSPNGTYALFHTKKGLWIIDLPALSDPVFLFEGTLPSIRPL